MKQYKFRAWDGQKMYSTDEVVIYLGKAWIENASFDPNIIHVKETPPLRVMQYTGMQDSEGKDIYEGDYLEYEWDFGGGLQKTELEVVDWAYTNCILCSGGGFDASAISKGFKIIGNIYETN